VEEFQISAACLLQRYLLRNADAPYRGAKEPFMFHAVFTILRYLSPKTLKIFFNAFRKKKKKKSQLLFYNGAIRN